VRDLIDVASDLQDLITIATGQPPAFDNLSLRHPEEYAQAPAVPGIPDSAAQERYLRPIELRGRWTVTVEHDATTLHAGDLYFTSPSLAVSRVSHGGLPLHNDTGPRSAALCPHAVVPRVSYTISTSTASQPSKAWIPSNTAETVRSGSESCGQRERPAL
jgi:hypothetical protein